MNERRGPMIDSLKLKLVPLLNKDQIPALDEFLGRVKNRGLRPMGKARMKKRREKLDNNK